MFKACSLDLTVIEVNHSGGKVCERVGERVGERVYGKVCERLGERVT